MIIDLPMAIHPGLYVVEFPARPAQTGGIRPARIKIGRSESPILRIGAHGSDGAVRGWISPPVRDLIGAEHLALGLVAERLGSVRAEFSWESFEDASFEDVVKVVAEAAERFPVPS